MSIYAVNGKEPIAAWIPSLDDTGNGTSTLTDLIGSVDGTLTDMDASTDWVSDTGAGGIRALDFDGTNDYIAFSSAAFSFSSSASLTMWVKLNTATPAIGEVTGLVNTRSSTGGASNHYPFTNGLIYLNVFRDARVDAISPSGSIARTDWHLVSVTTDGTNWVLRQNTTILTTATAEGSVTFNNGNFRLGMSNQGGMNIYLQGRLDDIRLFDVALDSSDISYLYNSGTGRGITAAAPIADDYSAVHMMIGGI